VLLAGFGGAAWAFPAQPPHDGPVVAPFEPPDPDWLPGHRGIDLGAHAGDAVRTSRAGVVAFAGMVAGVPVVVVQHAAVRATYQPVRSHLRPGTEVAAGSVIGAIAAGGGHCGGRCLHWGLVVAQRYLDPRLLLGEVSVRLVPHDDAGAVH
jgi:murein DD-endopeptidase MepM/ murein hydrolase activator NlpD